MDENTTPRHFFTGGKLHGLLDLHTINEIKDLQAGIDVG
jgi:hypothetical protein